MGKIYNEITIDAPIDRVWAVLADVEAVQHYNPIVATAKRTSETTEGIGTSRYCEFKDSGWVKERVTAFEPKSKISFEVVQSSWPVKSLRWNTHLKSLGTSTQLSQDLQFEVKFGLLGKLLEVFVMKRKMQQSLDEIFSNLKKYIEKD